MEAGPGGVAWLGEGRALDSDRNRGLDRLQMEKGRERNRRGGGRRRKVTLTQREATEHRHGLCDLGRPCPVSCLSFFFCIMGRA